MATVAALGKNCAAPALSAPLFQQDHFYARQSRFSWSPKLYFYDDHGKTLGFVRKPRFSWNREIRIFSDPTLSFELLRVRPVAKAGGLHEFQVIDSINRQTVGAIKSLPSGRLQRQEWSLVSATGQEAGTIKEDSLFRAGMRRLLSELIPQSYSFYSSSRVIGSAARSNNLFSPQMEVNLSGDSERQLDRRLVAAAMVLLMAPSAHQLLPE